MTEVDEARRRLLALLKSGGGAVAAGEIEADPWFSANQEVTCAAAHQLATDPRVHVQEDDDGRAWFPFSSISTDDVDTLAKDGAASNPSSWLS